MTTARPAPDAVPVERVNRVPIWGRDSGVRVLKAYALVSNEDYAWAMSHHWNLRGGYAGRVLPREKDGVQKKITMHVEILARMGHPRNTYDCCDHIDRTKLNNQRNNLRPATYKLNAENRDQQRLTGRPRVLDDPPPRPCRVCGKVFTPRRKTPNMASTLCSQECSWAGMPQTRLSKEQVREIRRRFSNNADVLATEYGVGAQYIRAVALGQARRTVS